MQCRVCATADLIHVTRDVSHTYKSETTIIAAVTGNFCPACREVILDTAESARVSAAMLAFSKEVNA